MSKEKKPHVVEKNEAFRGFNESLEILGRTFSDIDPKMSLDEIEMKMAGGVKVLMNCEAVSIAISDQGRDEILVKKTLIAESEWIYQVGLRQGEGLLGTCLMSKQAFLSNQPTKEEGFLESIDATSNLSIKSIIAIPLFSGLEVVGILACENKKDREFLPSDIHLLEVVGKMVIGPLTSVRMIQQLQVINAHLEASRWELIRSRNTLRSLIDNLPVSLYIIDRMYRLVAVNSARAKRVNGHPHSVVGKVCFEALYLRNEPCINCLVAETFFKKKTTFRAERYWQEMGESKEWEVGSYPILDESGGVLQVILVEEDVTERRRMEGILTQSEKMAAVGQLAAGIAHEINNPLTVILANAQILEKELPDDNDWKELANFIHRAGTRALNSVRNLLNFARKEPLDFEPISINETVERAIEMLKHEIMQRSVELTFEADPNLPELLASANNLQSVWLNLMMNAIDSTELTKGKIRVRSFQQGSEIRVSITDNGQGIQEESLSRIFEPFYTTKGPSRGTGLGLSICHRIIKQHGGHIQVDSVVNKGTTFTVVLPTF
jgi:two-component system, NtrC family, sensor kinase